MKIIVMLVAITVLFFATKPSVYPEVSMTARMYLVGVAFFVGLLFTLAYIAS